VAITSRQNIQEDEKKERKINGSGKEAWGEQTFDYEKLGGGGARAMHCDDAKLTRETFFEKRKNFSKKLTLKKGGKTRLKPRRQAHSRGSTTSEETRVLEKGQKQTLIGPRVQLLKKRGAQKTTAGD